MTSTKVTASCSILFTIFLLLPCIRCKISKVENFMSCQPQGNIKVVDKYNKTFNIYDVKINANLNNNEEIRPINNPNYYYNFGSERLDYVGDDSSVLIQFPINHVRFSGFVRPDDEVAEEKKYAEYIIFVTARAEFNKDADLSVVGLHDDGYYSQSRRTIRHCSVGFLEQYNTLQEKYFDEEVENTILDLIESCLLSHVCDNIERHIDSNWRFYNIQSSINEIVDKVSTSLIKIFIKPNTSLSNIAGTYTPRGFFSWVGADFYGTNMTIMNTPDVERASDVQISHDGLRITVGGDFRFYRLNLHFDDFKVSLGVGYTSGVCDVYVSRLTVALKVEFDYTNTPCETTLVDLNIYDVGRITIDRPNSSIMKMNNETSSFVNSIIIAKAHNITTKILNDKLLKFKCDEFSYLTTYPDTWGTFWASLQATIKG